MMEEKKRSREKASILETCNKLFDDHEPGYISSAKRKRENVPIINEKRVLGVSIVPNGETLIWDDTSISSKTECFINVLPQPLKIEIVSLLNINDSINIALTCHLWNQIVSEFYVVSPTEFHVQKHVFCWMKHVSSFWPTERKVTLYNRLIQSKMWKLRMYSLSILTRGWSTSVQVQFVKHLCTYPLSSKIPDTVDLLYWMMIKWKMQFDSIVGFAAEYTKGWDIKELEGLFVAMYSFVLKDQYYRNATMDLICELLVKHSCSLAEKHEVLKNICSMLYHGDFIRLIHTLLEEITPVTLALAFNLLTPSAKFLDEIFTGVHWRLQDKVDVLTKLLECCGSNVYDPRRMTIHDFVSTHIQTTVSLKHRQKLSTLLSK